MGLEGAVGEMSRWWQASFGTTGKQLLDVRWGLSEWERVLTSKNHIGIFLLWLDLILRGLRLRIWRWRDWSRNWDAPRLRMCQRSRYQGRWK